jgi:putative SOS response-associated peptidase YedK
MQFNARSETVQEKSVFSRLLSSQRCIFMCEGFYEWKKVGTFHRPLPVTARVH